MSRVCTFCVMDDSVTALRFDESGRCECCIDAERRRPHEWIVGAKGEQQLQTLIAELKQAGRGRAYDAMIGLSGGIDSAYLAHVAVRRYGLRVLAVHVDGGWNSAAAVHNIETMVRALDIDLRTFVVEWQEMRDIQLAFLRSSVFNQDIPQDHAFFSTLYRTAIEQRIGSFLSGVNFATENIMPPKFGPSYLDTHHIKALHARFGRERLLEFPLMSLQQFVWHSRVRKRLTVYRPLNFLPYDKEQARSQLQAEYGWRDYGGKHDESRFTKFYQDIFLPRKYGFDKRRLHLSSLIVAGAMSREVALSVLSTPVVEPLQARRETRFIAKKLGVSEHELQALIDAPPIDHFDYPNREYVQRALQRARDVLHSARRLLS